jgi:acyl CoA:acetate/3-ketoacid CoA transferase
MMEFLDARSAAGLVNDGDTVAISGNGAGMISAEAILAAVEQRFLETGHPCDLTLVHSLGLGDRDTLGNQSLCSRRHAAQGDRGAFHLVSKDSATHSRRED